MAKILFMNVHGNSETIDMEHVPRCGDTVPLFYTPAPKVNDVVWLPQKLNGSMPENIDVMIILG